MSAPMTDDELLEECVAGESEHLYLSDDDEETPTGPSAICAA